MTTLISDETARKILNRQQAPPTRVVDLADDFGVSVWEHDLGPQISGKLIKGDSKAGYSDYTILINSKEPYLRRRFTVAHELSHYLLHRELVKKLGGIEENTFYRAEGLNSWQEMEANGLASEILIPYHLINKFRSDNRTPADLARLFEVSVSAMRIRLSIGRLPVKVQ